MPETNRIKKVMQIAGLKRLIVAVEEKQVGSIKKSEVESIGRSKSIEPFLYNKIPMGQINNIPLFRVADRISVYNASAL